MAKKYTQAELQMYNRMAINYFDKLLREISGNVSDEKWGELDGGAFKPATDSHLDMGSSFDHKTTEKIESKAFVKKNVINSTDDLGVPDIYIDDEEISYQEMMRRKAQKEEVEWLRNNSPIEESVVPKTEQPALVTKKPPIVASVGDDEEDESLSAIKPRVSLTDTVEQPKTQDRVLNFKTQAKKDGEVLTEKTPIAKPKIDAKELLKQWQEITAKQSPEIPEPKVEEIKSDIDQKKDNWDDEFDSLKESAEEIFKEKEEEDDDDVNTNFDNWEIVVEKD